MKELLKTRVLKDKRNWYIPQAQWSYCFGLIKIWKFFYDICYYEMYTTRFKKVFSSYDAARYFLDEEIREWERFQQIKQTQQNESTKHMIIVEEREIK